MLEQSLPGDLQLQVIVIDDGSSDGTFEQLQPLRFLGVDLISLPVNGGRSAARNAGAHAARGDFIVFVDSDCLPVGRDFLVAHHAIFQDTSVVGGYGGVTGFDKGFWSRYQARASQRRRLQHERGDIFSGSSQNLSVRKSAFTQIGGFDTTYKEYGFEDRDLLIRLSRLGAVAWVENATVQHHDQLDMRTIARKMSLAGGSSALRFSRLHPQAYRVLGYAMLDARIHPIWRWISRPVSWLLPTLASVFDKCVPILPFTLSAVCVKALTGAAFMIGTCASTQTASEQQH